MICASTGGISLRSSSTKVTPIAAKVFPLLKVNGASSWHLWQISHASSNVMFRATDFCQSPLADSKVLALVRGSIFCPWQRALFSVTTDSQGTASNHCFWLWVTGWHWGVGVSFSQRGFDPQQGPDARAFCLVA